MYNIIEVAEIVILKAHDSKNLVVVDPNIVAPINVVASKLGSIANIDIIKCFLKGTPVEPI